MSLLDQIRAATQAQATPLRVTSAPSYTIGYFAAPLKPNQKLMLIDKILSGKVTDVAWTAFLIDTYPGLKYNLPKPNALITKRAAESKEEVTVLEAQVLSAVTVMAFVRLTAGDLKESWLSARLKALAKSVGLADSDVLAGFGSMTLEESKMGVIREAALSLKSNREFWVNIFRAIHFDQIDAGERLTPLVRKFSAFAGLLPYQTTYGTLFDPLSDVVLHPLLAQDLVKFQRAIETMLRAPPGLQAYARQLLSSSETATLDRVNFPMLYYVAFRVASMRSPTFGSVMGANIGCSAGIQAQLDALASHAVASISPEARIVEANNLGLSITDFKKRMRRVMAITQDAPGAPAQLRLGAVAVPTTQHITDSGFQGVSARARQQEVTLDLSHDEAPEDEEEEGETEDGALGRDSQPKPAASDSSEEADDDEWGSHSDDSDQEIAEAAPPPKKGKAAAASDL